MLTRRTTLGLIGGGFAAILAACVGGVSQVLGFQVFQDEPVTGQLEPSGPVAGAGLFDVDPDQGNVSQDPNVAIHGDIASLPEDMEV